jgi:mono/diheme cytochrome c family protein
MKRVILAVLLTSATALASAAKAADDPAGRAAYLKYCGACHGTDAKGDGPAAPALQPRPTDLTLIAKNHGGKFPYVAVKDGIDGTKSVAAHGNSAMPVWGHVLTSETSATVAGQAERRGLVQLITDYLATIQAH